QHALRDRLAAGRNGHPLLVACAIGVSRGVVGGPVAGPRLYDPELIEHRYLRAEDRKDWLDDRHVDDLTGSTTRIPRVQCEHGRDGAGQSGNAVRESERRQSWRSIWLPGNGREPRQAFRNRPETGSRRIRPELTERRHSQ